MAAAWEDALRRAAASISEIALGQANHIIGVGQHTKTPGFINKSSAALLAASKLGYAEIIPILLDLCANLDVEDDAGSTPLLNAITTDAVDVVQVLLAAGADTNKASRLVGGYMTPLKHAAKLGRAGMVALLLRAGADVNLLPSIGYDHTNALMCASTVEVCQLLLQAGADLHAKNHVRVGALHQAARTGNVDVVRCLVRAGIAVEEPSSATPYTPLMDAAELGHDSVVSALLEAGADATRALLPAVQHSRHTCVALLLQAGASANAAWSDAGSPLTAAAKLHDCDMLQLLIEADSDVNMHASDPDGFLNRHAPIFAAMQARDETGLSACVALLLNNGARPSSLGGAAWHLLVRHKDVDLMKQLLLAGLHVAPDVSLFDRATDQAALAAAPLLLAAGWDFNELELLVACVDALN